MSAANASTKWDGVGAAINEMQAGGAVREPVVAAHRTPIKQQRAKSYASAVGCKSHIAVSTTGGAAPRSDVSASNESNEDLNECEDDDRTKAQSALPTTTKESADHALKEAGLTEQQLWSNDVQFLTHTISKVSRY